MAKKKPELKLVFTESVGQIPENAKAIPLKKATPTIKRSKFEKSVKTNDTSLRQAYFKSYVKTIITEFLKENATKPKHLERKIFVLLQKEDIVEGIPAHIHLSFYRLAK